MQPTDLDSRSVLFVVALLAAVVAAAVAAPATAGTTDSKTVTVTEVVDGDTLDIRYENGTTDTVRLLGVDTPETNGRNYPPEYEGVPNDLFGAACLSDEGSDASEFMTARLEGEQVTLEFDSEADRRGEFGRLLAYVHYNGDDYNYKLVNSGRARVYDSTFSRSDSYYSAESGAQDRNRDLWRCKNAGGRGDIDIERIDADGGAGAETIVLENTYYDPVDLSGWTVTDTDGNTYTFPPGTVIGPESDLTLHTGSGTDTPTDVYWGRSAEVWEDGGDTVILKDDGGRLATTRPYPY